jgi:hypothetical protein
MVTMTEVTTTREKMMMLDIMIQEITTREVETTREMTTNYSKKTEYYDKEETSSNQH